MTAHLVAGLGFGDEGKGSIVDALVRHTNATLVVRYNGGAQAAHNVVTPEGKHHTFSQFGSGTFVPNVKTFLSKYVLVNPISMMKEEEFLRAQGVIDAFDRMYVSEDAVIVTPFHKALGRLKEYSRSKNRHGSTGMGIGQAREYYLKYGDSMLLARDLKTPRVVLEKLARIRELCEDEVSRGISIGSTDALREWRLLRSSTIIQWCMEKYAEWVRVMDYKIHSHALADNTGDIVFEGAQGMLLDEEWGFQPHTTWTDITFRNAIQLLKDNGHSGNTMRYGVLRSYFTRHGAGPLPSEAKHLRKQLKELHNSDKEFAGAFRVGHFDMPLTLYALHAIGGVDSLAINHLDTAQKLDSLSVRLSNDIYSKVTLSEFLKLLESMTRTPVSVLGYGPCATQKAFRYEEFNGRTACLG